MFVDEAFDFVPDVYTSPGDPFALETLAGPYAFPRFAGVRFRGVNLVPRPTDTGNGPNLPGAPVPANFYDLVYDWGTDGPTSTAWTQWVKPQIDAMRAIGVNCIRIIFQPTVRVGDSTHHGVETFRGVITQAQLNAVLDQLITYLASLGMYFYPAAMEASAVDVLTTAQILQFVTEFCTKCSNPAYTNVIGIDLSQECDRSTWAMTAGNLRQATQTAIAAMQVTRNVLPITSSVALYTNWATALPLVALAGSSYFDLHTYLYTDALWLTLQLPNIYGLPVVTGETGIGYNGFYFDPSASAQEVTHPFSSELRARHYQDFVAGVGQRFDQQLTEVWGTVKEWPADNQDWGLYSDAQNGLYAFTTPRTEMTGPLQTVPLQPQAYNVAHVLDLTGPDTTIAAWSAVSTFMLGWSQLDYSNTFSRSSHRVKRAAGALAVGVVDVWGLPSIDQSVSVDFDASQAVAVGGQIDWTVSVRHRGDTALNLAHTSYYFADIAAKPGDAAVDSLLSLYVVVANVPTLLDSVVVGQPFNLTHQYRFSLSASGTYPTTLTAVLTDLTTSTVLATRTKTDTTPKLQALGSPGIPSQIGTVYYTNVQYVTTNDLGPSLVAPVLGAATPTTLPISWAAVGGVTPYRYIPQYVPLDSNGFPSSAWLSRPTTTGTTDTIDGLSPSTRYAVRVQAIDARG